jgi:hypothetical protein
MLSLLLGIVWGQGRLPTGVTAAVPARPANRVVLPMSIGTNLYGVADWSTQVPFIDAFKSSRPWFTGCNSGDPGCDPGGEWDTQEAKLLDLDANGWIKSLPSPAAPPKFTRVGTVLYPGIPGRYPTGRYVVLYDGEGKISYDFVTKDEQASRPGRDVIVVKPEYGIYIGIDKTDPKGTGNYIRNIRVIPADLETNFLAGEIFHPTFLARTAPFKPLRLMDWMDTNASEQANWQNRPRPTWSTYARPGGVPLEIMVALANKLKADPWFTLPHLATDEYARNFATYVRDNLDPSLKAYVEYSNEVWNGMFVQQQWADAQGKARWGANTQFAYMKWYGSRAAQIARIWKQVYATQPQRLVTVFATQAGGVGIEGTALNAPILPESTPAAKFFDAYAIAPYLGSEIGSPDYQKTVRRWLQDADGGVGRAFRQLRTGDVLTANPKESRSLGVILEEVRYHAKVAKQYGLELVAYEGGQHLAGFFGVENDEQLTNFFIALNRHPNMYQLYRDLLLGWQQAGGKAFAHYSDIGQPTKWGSWGALEYASQSQTTPKYQALLDVSRMLSSRPSPPK